MSSKFLYNILKYKLLPFNHSVNFFFFEIIDTCFGEIIIIKNGKFKIYLNVFINLKFIFM